MPFALEPLDLVLLIVAALLIFGPRRLPEIGRGIGRALSEFQRGIHEMSGDSGREAARSTQPTRPVPTSSALVTDSRICPKCGHSNAGEARFCDHCGASLADQDGL
jgi:sec-independent protein translocase protein TatA